MNRNKVAVAISITFFTIGAAVVGYLVLGSNSTPQVTGASSPAIQTLAESDFVIGSTTNKEIFSIAEANALKSALGTDVSKAQSAGNITEAGIYFRDLNNGARVSVNSDALFAPASLLKLPLAMWFYRQNEEQPDFTGQEVLYKGPNGISVEHYPGLRAMVPGTTYTLEDIINLMLLESDNDAAALLAQYAGIANTDSVYRALGVTPVVNYQTYTMSVTTYSSFFRVLYNGSYLDLASSAHILELLSQASFKSGLVAGVPPGIVVAHKFGEHVVDSGKNINQLHDCGIVYVPHKPYILCIMTQGHDYGALASFIASTSALVYSSVSSAKGY